MISEKINVNAPPEPQRLWRIMEKQRTPAIYWYNKCVGGDKGEKRKVEETQQLIAQRGYKDVECVFSSEWVSSSKTPEEQNRWLVAKFLSYTNGGFWERDVVVAFYESHGSVGFARQFMLEEGSTVSHGCIDMPEKVLLMFDTHFFLRYCDTQRQLGTMLDDKQQVLLEFFKRNPLLMVEGTVNVYRGKGKSGRMYVDMAIGGGVARGYVITEGDTTVYWMKTCLTYQMLHRGQYRVCRDILDSWYKTHVKVFGKAVTDSQGFIADGDEVPEVEEAKRTIGKISIGRKNRMTFDAFNFFLTNSTGDTLENSIRAGMRRFQCSRTEFVEMFVYAEMMLQVAIRMCGDIMMPYECTKFTLQGALEIIRFLNYRSDHGRLFETDELGEVRTRVRQLIVNTINRGNFKVRYDIDEVLESNEAHLFLPESLAEIKERSEEAKRKGAKVNRDFGNMPLSITGKPLDVADKNSSNNNSNNNISTDHNVMNKNQITEIKALMKKSLKSFEKLVAEATNLKYDSYLQQVEPLFVISRIMPWMSDKEREKAMEAQKLWMERVVDNRWCSALEPYIKEMGKELVTLAIIKTMESVDAEGNSFWKSPRGKEQLDRKTWDYQSLEVIRDAATCLCDEEGIDPMPEQDEPDTVAEPTGNVLLDGEGNALIEFCDLAASDDMNITKAEAQKELIALGLNLNKINASMARLARFVKDSDADVDITKKAAADAMAESERLRTAYNKKKEEVDSIKAERDRKQQEINALNNALNTAKQKLNNMEAEYQEWLKTRREQADRIKALDAEVKQLRETKGKPQVIEYTYGQIHAACPLISLSNFRALTAFFIKDGGKVRITGVE